MSGFARTGKWFAFQNWAAQPDLIVFAKGSNSGYVPVGGVVISKDIAATFDERVFPGGLTYSGHPLAAASIVASIDAMKEEKVVENAANIGATVLGPGLRDLAERHPVMGDIRGLGVFWGIDLVTNRATRDPIAPYGGTSPAMTELVVECKKRGLMPFTNFNRLHVVPPCIVTESEAKEGLAILDEVLSITDTHYTG
jgi:taurine--2-oxoglutarate transaminase